MGQLLDQWPFQALSFLAWAYSKKDVPVLVVPGSVGVPSNSVKNS
jgi:hypothetical protein